jgi:hypothetical protein
VAHCESVLRDFYDLHLEAGTGPMLKPDPAVSVLPAAAARTPPNSAPIFTTPRAARPSSVRDSCSTMPPGAERDSEVRLATLELAMAEFFANVAGADR